MRVEIAGAQISDAVVDVLDTLQNEADVARAYIDTLDALTRALILDIDGDDADDASTLSRLRALQLLRRDIATLASPPGADAAANDVPTASL